MGLSRQLLDQTPLLNSVYKITLDMSGWDRTTVQVVPYIYGAIYVYGSNDPNAVQGVQMGNAELAINFTPVQATNLATGTAVNAITAAGNYKVDVNTRFLRFQGNPITGATITNVYKILFNHSKVS